MDTFDLNGIIRGLYIRGHILPSFCCVCLNDGLMMLTVCYYLTSAGRIYEAGLHNSHESHDSARVHASLLQLCCEPTCGRLYNRNVKVAHEGVL